MTICFSQLTQETQKDIAETFAHCFPTINERQRVYQIANIYIPFHSIADPVDIWMYVFQSIQKSPKKTLALLEASYFILTSRQEETIREIASNDKDKIVEPDQKYRNVLLQQTNENLKFHYIQKS